MPVGNNEPQTLDERLADVKRATLLEIIESIKTAVTAQGIAEKDEEGLRAVIADALAAATPMELGALLRDRLERITRDASDNLPAIENPLPEIANPAVRLLKRRPLGREHPEANQFRYLLAGSAAYPLEELGELILDQNPYYEDTDGILTEDELDDVTMANNRLGGAFRFFNSMSTWAAGKPGPSADFPHIPHPDEGAPPGYVGYQPTWYMVTGRTPKSLNDDITQEPQDVRDRARNIVKTLEIEYGPLAGIFTGEIVGGLPKNKRTHIFIMYAGGNGS